MIVDAEGYVYRERAPVMAQRQSVPTRYPGQCFLKLAAALLVAFLLFNRAATPLLLMAVTMAILAASVGQSRLPVATAGHLSPHGVPYDPRATRRLRLCSAAATALVFAAAAWRLWDMWRPL